MTDSDMVERVARAIYTKAESLGVSVDTAEGGGDLTGATIIARAAIEAMREPTPSMERAAAHFLLKSDYMTHPWRAMIDAALQRGEK